MCTFDLTDGLLHGTGECTAFVPEQFAFQQVFRNGAAVDGNKRLLGAWPEVMYRPRHGFLAGAAFAQQQDRNVGGCDPLNITAGFQHARAGGDDALYRGPSRQSRETAVFVLQPMQVQTAFDDRPKHLDLDWLLAEIVCTQGDGAECVLPLAVAGDDDHLGLWCDAQHVG